MKVLGMRWKSLRTMSRSGSAVRPKDPFLSDKMGLLSLRTVFAKLLAKILKREAIIYNEFEVYFC